MLPWATPPGGDSYILGSGPLTNAQAFAQVEPPPPLPPGAAAPPMNGSSYAGGGLGEPAYSGVPVYANVYTPARKVYSPPAGRQPYILAGGCPALTQAPPSTAATAAAEKQKSPAAGAASPAASPAAVAQFEEPAEEIWRPFSRNTGGAAAYSLPPPLSPSASFSQLGGQTGPPTALPPTPELLAEHEAALAAAASPRAGNGRAAAAPFGRLAVRTKRAATRGNSATAAPGGQAAARGRRWRHAPPHVRRPAGVGRCGQGLQPEGQQPSAPEVRVFLRSATTSCCQHKQCISE